MEEFNCNLLKISIIQILKSNGFDKVKPSTLNVLTDLYILNFEKLVQSVIKFSNIRNDKPDSMDVLQAMIDIGLIKINLNDLISNRNQLHDDTSKYNTKSIESFKHWLASDNFLITKKLNQLPLNFKQVIYENRKSDGTNKVNEISNNDNLENGINIDIDGNIENNQEMKELDKLNVDWLTYLIEKDIKFGKNKFNNSIFFPDNVSEYILEGGGDYNKYLPGNDEVIP